MTTTKKKRMKWTPDVIERVRGLAAAGMARDLLAAEIGVSVEGLIIIAHRQGIPLAPRARRKEPLAKVYRRPSKGIGKGNGVYVAGVLIVENHVYRPPPPRHPETPVTLVLRDATLAYFSARAARHQRGMSGRSYAAAILLAVVEHGMCEEIEDLMAGRAPAGQAHAQAAE